MTAGRSAEAADDESAAQGDAAGGSAEGSEPPPADFDPAEHPSNPDLVDDENPEH